MKRNKIPVCLMTVLSVVASSCSDFLDTVPDNRTEVDGAGKITSLLVSAYPSYSPFLMAEMSSDNMMDNGVLFDAMQLQEDCYLWQDPTDVSYDTPYALWQACYSAIASANQALESIRELGDPISLRPQKGEALLCRAYSHFVLANIFCMPYNPETAEQQLGIPYPEEPEKEVFVYLDRGTLAQTYERIEKDIEAGLPLISDIIYSVPKYHFNKKAANAFAARFYLYYQKWDKVIEHADVVLGSNPASVIRHWEEDFGALSLADDVANQYTSEKKAANLLLNASYSSWPIVVGRYDIYKRYGHGMDIYATETIKSDGPWNWRGGLAMTNFIISIQQKNPFPKLDGHFEYTDKTSGIGYNHMVSVIFSCDETLLCRAEAYALQKNYAKALEDANVWIKYNNLISQDSDSDLTLSTLNSFYRSLRYAPILITSRQQRSVKKTLNPEGFTVASGAQENLIQLILQLRRLSGLQEGLRWYDLKRYGIEFSHNRGNNTPIVLTKDDPRRAIQLPQDVINAGVQPNPRNN